MVDDELVGGYVYAVTVEAEPVGSYMYAITMEAGLANQIECARYAISIGKTIGALRFASKVAVRSIENYLIYTGRN